MLSYSMQISEQSKQNIRSLKCSLVLILKNSQMARKNRHVQCCVQSGSRGGVASHAPWESSRREEQTKEKNIEVFLSSDALSRVRPIKIIHFHIEKQFETLGARRWGLSTMIAMQARHGIYILSAVSSVCRRIWVCFHIHRGRSNRQLRPGDIFSLAFALQSVVFHLGRAFTLASRSMFAARMDGDCLFTLFCR